MKIKYFLLGSLFTLTFIAIAVISFYLGKKSNDDTSTQISELQNTTTITPSPTDTPVPTNNIFEEISYSIENKEYVLLEDYFTNPVSIKIENSSCCKPMTPNEAVTQMDYLKSAKGTWIFDQEGEVVKILAATFPDRYSNAYIGLSTDYYCVAFQLDKNNKIFNITMTSSYKKLLQQ